MNNPCKLLVVDDSKIMRRFITELFAADRQIQIVGEAVDGLDALSKLSQLGPDVITLDIMIRSPKPTVMLSTLTQEGAKITFDALRYGAVDFITKPNRLEGDELAAQAEELTAKVKLAAAVALDSVQYIRGAAEGGYGALLKIIPHLRADAPVAYLVILYTAPPHLDAFIQYLNSYSGLPVRRAVDRALIEPGVCYFGSGNEYITVAADDQQFALQVHRAPFASRRGSIDRLMFSVAETLKQQAAGVILSGAGEDGSEGLEEIQRMAGVALIQDPQSCLHKDMAVAALARCRPDYLFSDAKIAAVVNGLL